MCLNELVGPTNLARRLRLGHIPSRVLGNMRLRSCPPNAGKSTMAVN
jgi:hypothetical protein